MSSAPARPLWQGRSLALVGLVLFAFALRVGVASLSPVIDHVARDFPMPAVVVGLIGTAPPVSFALLGIVTPLLERRFGLERLAVMAAIAATIGMVLRAFAVDSISLLLATTVIFAAVGVGNVILPPLVKTYFPDRIGLLTTVYSTTMAIATFLPPLVAVPMADAAGWRFSLGLWAVFAAASALPWIALLIADRRRGPAVGAAEDPAPGVLGRLWRLPLAWAMTVTLAVSGILVYTCFAWLPQILVDIAGVTPAVAGALLSLFAFIGLPLALVVPVVVVRFDVIRSLVLVAVAAGLVGVTGLLVAPATLTWLWVVLLGTTPLVFPIVLVLISLRSRTHAGAVALSGFSQSVGYAITALFPFTFGLLHDATGTWTIALLVLGVVIAVALVSGMVIARPHTIEDEWERRHGAW